MRFVDVDVLFAVGPRLFVPVAQSMTDFVAKDRAFSSYLTKNNTDLYLTIPGASQPRPIEAYWRPPVRPTLE